MVKKGLDVYEKYEINSMGKPVRTGLQGRSRWYRSKWEKMKAQPRTAGNVDEEIL